MYKREIRLDEQVKVIGSKEIGKNSIEEEMSNVGEIFSTSISKSVSLPKSSIRVASRTSLNKYGCIVPPYNPATILQYKSLDSTYQSCIDVKVLTTVGLGYTFGAKDNAKLKAIKEFFRLPNRNSNESFLKILKAVYTDYELFKNGYFEYIKSGSTKSIYYLPAKDVYILPKKSGGLNTREIDKYVYMPSDQVAPVYYEPYPYDGKTRDGVKYVLHLKEISQEDLYFGKPDTAHLFDLIKQSYLSDQYNINFFSNGGQPAWAVLVTGSKLSKKSYEKIKEFIENNLKGVGNAHKMLFLSVPNEKAKITLVPLSKSIDEQFISLNDKVQFKIALKCRVHPKLLGLSTGGNFGGGSAGMGDLKLYLETVCFPGQIDVEEFINRFCEFEFKYNPEFVLKAMNISNEKDDAVIANLFFNMRDEFGNRVLGVNEVRSKNLNLDPIKLNDTPVDVVNDTSIKPTKDGEMKTSDKSSLNIGDGEDASNLDPDKNNDAEERA